MQGGHLTTLRPVVGDGPERGLEAWLDELGTKFCSLSTDDRNRTLDHIISMCDSGQLYHLSTRLAVLLRRDFLMLLPRDIVLYLACFLDVRSLTTCCLVSRGWNSLINSCTAAWKVVACKQGVNLTGQELSSALVFKELYLAASHCVRELRARKAFDRSVMYGHRSRVMTIYYHKGVIATGSDDHTVRLWDCQLGVCTQTIETHHTVALVKFDSVRLITASFNTMVVLWSVSTGARLQVYMGHVGAVFSADFDAEMDLLVTGSADGTVKVWQLSSGKMLASLPHSKIAWITQVCVHRAPCQSAYSVLSRDDSTVRRWLLTQHHIVSSTEKLHLPHGSTLLPGWQVSGSTVTYVTYSAPNKYHVMVAGLRADTDCCLVVRTVTLHKAPQGFLGCGRMFCVLLTAIDGERSEITVLHNTTNKIIATVPMPPDYRPSERNATFTLGRRAWLDGLSPGGERGTFLACVLHDNGIIQLRWRDSVLTGKHGHSF